MPKQELQWLWEWVSGLVPVPPVYTITALRVAARAHAGTNGIMNVWEVNTAALLPPAAPAAPAAAAASSSKPDWAQLVGDPALYEELQDYFCYAQLTTQPLDTTGGFTLNGGGLRLLLP
jgi:hypothetical protein